MYPKLKPLDQEAASSGRLELVAQYKLNGNVASMDIVRTSSPRGKQGCDSLLLAFSDAKMSLLEWSPATNSIVTVSIHYYEREEFKVRDRIPVMYFYFPPFLLKRTSIKKERVLDQSISA